MFLMKCIWPDDGHCKSKTCSQMNNVNDMMF
jgi:hypothetical protein